MRSVSTRTSLRTSDACLSVFSLPHVFSASLERLARAGSLFARRPGAVRAMGASLARGYRRPRIGLVWGGNPRLAPRAHQRPRSPAIDSTAGAGSAARGSGREFLLAAKGRGGQPAGYRVPDGEFRRSHRGHRRFRRHRGADGATRPCDHGGHFGRASGRRAGRPVWLLNRFDSCWRWGPQRTDAPWYPTMRIFRQPAFGEWAPAIERVASELISRRSNYGYLVVKRRHRGASTSPDGDSFDEESLATY